MTVTVRYYQEGDIVDDTYRVGDQLCSMRDIIVRYGTFARSLVIDSQVVGAFGCCIRYPGVADAWAVISDDARGHGLAVTRAIRRQMQQWIVELQVWRVSAFVVAGERVHEYARWIHLLGFEFEGVEECAGPHAEDLWRYRWISPAVQ